MSERESPLKKQKTVMSTTIYQLPFDTLIEIMNYLDIQNVAYFYCTCKHFKRLQETECIKKRIIRYSKIIKERRWDLGIDVSTTTGEINELIIFVEKKLEADTEYYLKWYLNNGLRNAARYGHIQIAKFLVDRGADDFDGSLAKAIKGRHTKIMHFLIQKGAEDWDVAMCAAARIGSKDLVDFFIEKGASDWTYGMKYAAKGGHKDIIDFFITKGARDLNLGMVFAIKGGHKKTCRIFYRKGCR
jgi:hypothetical protein